VSHLEMPMAFDFFRNFFSLNVRRPSPPLSYSLVNHLFADKCQSFLRYNLGLSMSRAVAIAQTLFHAMSDESLHYHTPIHVLSILEFANQNEIRLTTEQQLAIWFHDSVYVPQATNNEARSALLMRALIGECQFLDKASEYIMATAKFGSEEPMPEDAELVMDLDLCAFTDDVFVVYDKCIAAEFIPVFGEVPYRQGRIQFFNKMLAKKKIFRTAFMSRFEDSARKVLTNAVNAL